MSFNTPVTADDARELQDALWDRVDRAGADDCWEWSGPRHPQGYGRVRLPGRRTEPTHRVAYMIGHGDIPASLEVDHLCGNPPCCNPRHLEAVTRNENARRAAERRASVRGVGSIEVRECASGTRYRVRYRVSGRQKVETFSDRAEAEARLASLRRSA